MFDYILFDFDGTVFDTVEGITKSIRYALNKHDMDAPLDELRCFAGPPLVDMFMEKYGVDKETAVQFVADFRERYKPIGLYECCVFPGVKELLTELKARGKHLAIASSKPQELIIELLQREDMFELFESVCGTVGDINDAKWQVCERAMKELSADKDSCVLVGDTKYDVIGAHKCGIKCVGVEYGYAAPGDFEACGADYIVKDTAELLALLG